jgi:hypothetical protein
MPDLNGSSSKLPRSHVLGRQQHQERAAPIPETAPAPDDFPAEIEELLAGGKAQYGYPEPPKDLNSDVDSQGNDALPDSPPVDDPAQQEAPPYGSIDGAAVLLRVEAWYRRFIRVTFEPDYHLLALWTVHTHLAEECYTTPRLQLDSLVEGAGKTTVLDHLKRLAHNPIQIASLSSPALLPRLLHNGMRTILLDEVHRTLHSDKPGVGDLVAIINTGYRRGATRPVNVPVKNGGWEVVEMPTFAPVAVAGNDPNLANDTRSRMIRVLLMPDLDGSVEDSDWEYLEDDANALGGDWPVGRQCPRDGQRDGRRPSRWVCRSLQGEMASDQADCRGRRWTLAEDRRRGDRKRAGGGGRRAGGWAEAAAARHGAADRPVCRLAQGQGLHADPGIGRSAGGPQPGLLGRGQPLRQTSHRDPAGTLAQPGDQFNLDAAWR